MNHVAAFVGGTTSTARDETHFTLGGDYLRRLGERPLSIGGFVEAVLEEYTTWVLGPQLRWHVRRGFWLAFEPVVEVAAAEGEHEVDGEEASEPERETRALFRIGAGYEFELGRLSVEPNLSVDLSKEAPSWVWGVSIGTIWRKEVNDERHGSLPSRASGRLARKSVSS